MVEVDGGRGVGDDLAVFIDDGFLAVAQRQCALRLCRYILGGQLAAVEQLAVVGLQQAESFKQLFGGELLALAERQLVEVAGLLATHGPLYHRHQHVVLLFAKRLVFDAQSVLYLLQGLLVGLGRAEEVGQQLQRGYEVSVGACQREAGVSVTLYDFHRRVQSLPGSLHLLFLQRVGTYGVQVLAHLFQDGGVARAVEIAQAEGEDVVHGVLLIVERHVVVELLPLSVTFHIDGLDGLVVDGYLFQLLGEGRLGIGVLGLYGLEARLLERLFVTHAKFLDECDVVVGEVLVGHADDVLALQVANGFQLL